MFCAGMTTEIMFQLISILMSFSPCALLYVFYVLTYSVCISSSLVWICIIAMLTVKWQHDVFVFFSSSSRKLQR